MPANQPSLSSSPNPQHGRRPASGIWRLRRTARLALIVALSLLALPVATPAQTTDYVLGPQDVLRIRVFEWRPNAGVAFEWAPLTGEFAVSATGALSLPIIGTVPVSGRTLDEVSDLIGEQLQKQVGLQKRPRASVEVSEYRPFFVAGLVSSPGKYSYVPGLTVIQALSMAGGLGQGDSSMFGLQREVLVNRGDLRQLAVERLALLARQARVDAFLNDEATISFQEELKSRSHQPDVDRMMRDEQTLLESRLHSIKTEMDGLAQSVVLATNQLKALKLKEATLAKQIELATKDLDVVNRMVSQGLTVSSRQLGANQNVADLESRNLDVSLAIVKTQQDIAKLSMDTIDRRQKYRADALKEAADLRDRLAANSEKARTTRSLLMNIEMQAPAALAALEAEGEPTFVTTLSRSVGGVMQTMVVNDNDAVAPGDVIRVERRNDPSNTNVQEGGSGTQ